MASAIKIEPDQFSSQSLCHGCLTRDRKLKPLTGVINKVFYSLIAPGTLYGSEERMICWECEAILRRVRKFQNQICEAQNKLMEMFYNTMDPGTQTLSNLSTTIKDHYDLYYEFIELKYIEIESDLKANEDIPATIPKSAPTEVQPTENYSIKTETLELKLETDDDNHDQDTNNLETGIKNKETTKELKNELRFKNGKLKKSQTFKYHLKYAKIKDLNAKFGKVNSYFVEEFLDLEQVTEPEPEKTHHWFKYKECKSNLKAKYLYLLQKNLNQVQTDSLTTCLLCKKKLPDLDELRTHWKMSHCAFWRCILCNSYCKQTGRLHHLKFQHTKVYCCTKCYGEFRCKTQFNEHFKKDHDTYICHHCGKVCNAESSIIRHLLSSHSENKCKICNKNFKGRSHLLRHINVFHPETINKKVDKEAAYCVECNKQFKSVDLFKKHLFDSPKHTYRAPQSIPCPECGKIFSRKSYMKNHLHLEHMREKAKWKCTICEKYFANNCGLKRHYKNIHLRVPQEKNKICDICGRGFYANRILINHRRTHTGERPYQCAYCSATFAQKTAMVSHQKSQHRDMTQSVLSPK